MQKIQSQTSDALPEFGWDPMGGEVLAEERSVPAAVAGVVEIGKVDSSKSLTGCDKSTFNVNASASIRSHKSWIEGRE